MCRRAAIPRDAAKQPGPASSVNPDYDRDRQASSARRPIWPSCRTTRASGSARFALGFEAGARGPQSWTDFTTPEPTRLEHFACPGRVTSVGGHVIYGATYSWVTFYPAAQKTVKIASSGHGWGFGGGLSTIAGIWKLRSTGC